MCKNTIVWGERVYVLKAYNAYRLFYKRLLEALF